MQATLETQQIGGKVSFKALLSPSREVALPCLKASHDSPFPQSLALLRHKVISLVKSLITSITSTDVVYQGTNKRNGTRHVI